MGQLHELIAVEGDAKNTAVKILAETQHTFATKKDHFVGSAKTYNPFNDADRDRPEAEVKPIVTTVGAKLKYTMPYIVKHMDIILQKERTNAVAKANLLVDDGSGKDVEIAKDLPVTALVQYEKILTSLRGVLENIPTLDPLHKWKKDEQEGIYKTEEFKRVRTRKMQKPITLAEATDKHPAQAQLITTDEPVGEFKEVLTAGSLSPLEKSQMLARCDTLIEGVKRARSRANKTETDTSKIGQTLINLIIN
ncbi:MAG TPA: hypothetical protein VI911_10700 [Patescibacteria group bacterium]|nr:hypothetical protein [Patescibacteria group bacterium]